MKWGGVAAGVLLGLALVGMLWGTAVLNPPENVSRTIAALAAIYPGSIRGAVIERIPCPPLKHLRLYVVCTKDCEETWAIVGASGLWAETLANPGRLPPQAVEESRARIAAAVARDRRTLDSAGAREMVACYLRVEGYLPELILDPADRLALDSVRGSEDGMRRLAESLDARDAASRVDIAETDDGFAARLFYWNTALPDRPLLEMRLTMRKDGVLRFLEVREPVTDDSAPGSTPGMPPS